MKSYLLAVILTLSISATVKPQQPLVGMIQGKITDQKQAPIPFASLTATNIDSVEQESHRRATSADAHGFYQFVDVPEGRYSILIKKNGYEDYRVSEVTVHPGETVNMPEIKMVSARRR